MNRFLGKVSVVAPHMVWVCMIVVCVMGCSVAIEPDLGADVNSSSADQSVTTDIDMSESLDQGVFADAGSVCSSAADCPTGSFCDDGNGCRLNDETCGETSNCVLGWFRNDESDCVSIDAPIGSTCDDGDPATSNDVCDANGGCAGTAVTCPPSPICTEMIIGDGECETVSLPMGASCDDEDTSTRNDQCDGQGRCVGEPITCPDETTCLNYETNGVDCVPSFVPAATPCDDDVEATVNDQCDGQGACVGFDGECPSSSACIEWVIAGLGCDSEFAEMGTECDDQNPATREDRCSVNGVCSGQPFTCSASEQCTNYQPNGDVCDSIYLMAGTPCSDGSLATAGDQCDGGGLCVGSPIECDDGNQCTLDNADPARGCVHTRAPDGTACTDGDNATANDACQAGVCVGTAYSCDDGNVCTVGVHDGMGGCNQQIAINGLACTDGDNATVNDACRAGVCVGTSYSCDDGNVCTVGVHDGFGGCDQAPVMNGMACTDGDNATANDKCQAGVCMGIPYSCDDGNECTVGAHDGMGGCNLEFAMAGTACNDGDNATSNDACEAGVCVGIAYSCDDGNVCTVGVHDGTGGCSQTPVMNGMACTDGDNATANDACQAGICVGTAYSCDDGNVCTVGVHDGLGGCDQAPVINGMACTDGDNATANDACQAGVCLGTPYSCDDGNICTRDVPDGSGGCTKTAQPDGSQCDDNDNSTVADACKDGSCLGQPIICDDNNDCTRDIRDRALGCVHEPLEFGSLCFTGSERESQSICDGAGHCVRFQIP